MSDEEEKMLNQLKELLRKRNLDDNLSPRPHLNSILNELRARK